MSGANTAMVWLLSVKGKLRASKDCSARSCVELSMVELGPANC